MKEYKSRTYRIIINLAGSIAASLFVAFVVDYFFGAMYAIISAIVILLLSIWLLVLDTFITIVVSENVLKVIKKGNTQEYEIDKCSFRASTTTSGGETTCKLTVIEQNGQEHLIDCDLIGIKQFNMLLEDLRIIGDNAQVQKLDTTKGDK